MFPITNIKLRASADLARLAKFLYGFFDQVFSVGAVFLANILLARSTSESDYGVFVLVYSIFTFLSGMHNALILETFTVYASGRYRESFKNYLQFAFWVNIAIVMAMAGFLCLLAGFVSIALPSLENATIWGLAIGIPFLLTGAFFRRAFYIDQDSLSAAKISFYYFSIVCVALVSLILLGKMSGHIVFLVLSFGWVIPSPVFLRKHHVKKFDGRFLSVHPDYWSDHWRYSKWVLVTALVFQLINQGYYWIVGGLLTIEDVGKLKAVQNVVTPINLVFASISLFILPRMALVFQRDGIKEINHMVLETTLLVSGVALAFYLLILFQGEHVLNLLYAGKYTNSAYLLYILAITPLAFGIGNVFNIALKAIERPKIIFFAYAVGGIVTVLIGVPLVWNYGLNGAALGLVVSSLAYSLTLIAGFYLARVEWLE